MTPAPRRAADGRVLPMVGSAIVILVALAGLWGMLSDQDTRSPDDLVDAGPSRVQPLEWISFEEPEGAWGYDRISSTTTFGWLADRSAPGNLGNLEVSVAPRDRGLAEVRADYRDGLEMPGSLSRIDETDRMVPGTDAAVLLSASGNDDDADVAVVVLLMAVDDRIVTFVISAGPGGPSASDLRSTVDSVRIDREGLLSQLG